MSAADNGRHLLLSVVDPKLATTTTHYAPPFLTLILPEHIPSRVPICFTILHALTTTSIYFPLKLPSHAPPWTTVLVFPEPHQITQRQRDSLSLSFSRFSICRLFPCLPLSPLPLTTPPTPAITFFWFPYKLSDELSETHSLAIMASAQLREKLGYLKQQTETSDDRRYRENGLQSPTSEKPPLTTWEDGKESGCTCGGREEHRSLQKRNSRCPGSTRKPQKQERRIRAAMAHGREQQQQQEQR